MATIEQEQKRLFNAIWRLETSLRKVLRKTPVCVVLLLTPICYLFISLVCDILKTLLA